MRHLNKWVNKRKHNLLLSFLAWCDVFIFPCSYGNTWQAPGVVVISVVELWESNGDAPTPLPKASASPKRVLSFQQLIKKGCFSPTKTLTTQAESKHTVTRTYTKPKLTAMRSRVPLTAAHRSCRRSMTRMKPTSVEDKLEHTERQLVQHKWNSGPLHQRDGSGVSRAWINSTVSGERRSYQLLHHTNRKYKITNAA